MYKRREKLMSVEKAKNSVKSEAEFPVIETQASKTAEILNTIVPPKETKETAKDDLSEFAMPEDQAASDYNSNLYSLGINPDSLPEEKEMIKKIDGKLDERIKVLFRKAKKLTGKITEGAAYELNNLIAKIRRLRQIIANLISASKEYIKKLYIHLFMQERIS